MQIASTLERTLLARRVAMETPAISLRVGIADDVRSDRELLSQMLQALGHEVVIQAHSGQELVDACLAQRPDLVITDNLMPDVPGIDAAARIYDRCPLPVILLSAHSDPQAVLMAELRHVLVYLVKPLDKSTLEAAISLAHARFTETEFGDFSPGPRSSRVDETRENVSQTAQQQTSAH
jgi:AmiR/NasT family two-component response regulator